MALSALPAGSFIGRSVFKACVWKYSVPKASWLPNKSRAKPLLAFSEAATKPSKKRLTCRALRATSDIPFFWWSSSSRTTIGIKISCSAKRNNEFESCNKTLVSSTKSLRCDAGKRSFWVSAWLAADGVVVTFFVVGCLLVLALGVFSGAVLWVCDDGVGLALLAVFLLAAFFAADFLLGVGKSSGRLKIAPIRVGNLGKGMLI